MLSIKNLSVTTRSPILEGVSLDFSAGNLYGLVAINGSGKTTFFRAVMGLIPVKTGVITLSDSNKKFHKENEIFYWESSEWFDKNLTGIDYLTFVKNEWQSTVDINKIIQQWEMSEYCRLPIKTYSLGMKQRLLISLYIVSQANYWFMDEITNGLDEYSRKKLFATLEQTKKEGKVVILSSHYKEDIEEYCDYLLEIKNMNIEVIPL